MYHYYKKKARNFCESTIIFCPNVLKIEENKEWRMRNVKLQQKKD